MECDLDLADFWDFGKDLWRFGENREFYPTLGIAYVREVKRLKMVSELS